MSFKCSISGKYICVHSVWFLYTHIQHTHTIQRISKTHKKLVPTQKNLDNTTNVIYFRKL